MFRCPVCNSENYHYIPGYGADCNDCGYACDGYGRPLDSNETEEGGGE